MVYRKKSSLSEIREGKGNTMQKIIKRLENFENFAVAIVFIIMVVAIFFQVLNRTILQFPISWMEELARYCMVFVTMFGAEMGLRDGSQISVTSLTEWLPPVGQKVVVLFANFIVVAFSAIVFVYSITTLQKQMISGQLSPSLKLPMYVPYMSITAAFFVITLVQTVRFISRVINFSKEENNLPGVDQ